MSEINSNAWEYHPRFNRDDVRLLEILYESGRDDLRAKARLHLQTFGADAVPMFLYYARAGSDRYRRDVLTILDRIHPDGLVPALIAGLGDGEPQVRKNACRILAGLRAEAAPAARALTAVMPRHPDTRDDAAQALALIGPTAAPALMDLLEDTTTDESTRELALHTLEDCLYRAAESDPEILRTVRERMSRLSIEGW